MDKFHRNKPAIRIKVIIMGNTETGKVGIVQSHLSFFKACQTLINYIS